MRFLLLNQFYPPDVAPTGRVLHDLARTLVRRRHDVLVVCSRRSYDGGRDYPASEVLDGVRVLRLPALGCGRRGFAGRFADYASYAALLSLKILVDVPRPNLVLSLTTPPFVGLLANLTARLRGSRHAHWIMDLYPDVLAAHGIVRRESPLFTLLATVARTQAGGAKLVLSLGPYMARSAERYAGNGTACAWVPLWGDEGLAPWPAGQENPLRRERGWRTDELVLLYSGNMGLGHRFGEFLAAAERTGRNGPRWAFVGGGARRGEIETFAWAHPDAPVELLPYAPASRLRESLASGDVHLVSLDSAWQGLMVPSKIQAIFSVGRPALFVGARKNEIAAWIEESGAGWIVAENDVEGLLCAVESARDPAERARRGEAALRFARSHFDADRNLGRIAGLLEAAAVSGGFRP